MALGWRQISRRMGNGAGRLGILHTLFFCYLGAFLSFVFISPFFYAFMRDN